MLWPQITTQQLTSQETLTLLITVGVLATLSGLAYTLLAVLTVFRFFRVIEGLLVALRVQTTSLREMETDLNLSQTPHTPTTLEKDGIIT